MPASNKPRPGKPVLDTAFSSGLSRLIGSPARGSARDIPIDLIEANPFNPRRIVDPQQVAELTESIRQHGFLGALDGRRKAGSDEIDDDVVPVELAYGARRLVAAREAGLKHLPVVLHTWDDGQMRLIALVENVQRQDLSPLEEADAIGAMQRELGWSIRKIVEMTGKNKAWVEDAVALAAAPEDVRRLVSARADSVRHAHYIARLADPDQRERLIRLVEAHSVTARQVQEMVQAVESGIPVDEAVRRMQKAAAGRQLALGHRPRQPATPQVHTEYHDLEYMIQRAGDLPRPVAAASVGALFMHMAVDELLQMQPGARLIMRKQLVTQAESAAIAIRQIQELLDAADEAQLTEQPTHKRPVRSAKNRS